MLPKLRLIDPRLPDRVARRLESMLYAAPLSTVAYVLGLMVMPIALWLRTGDPVISSLSIAILLLIMLRVGFVKLCRSTPAYLPTLLAFGLVYSALLVALVVRAFSLGDDVAIALVVIAAAGYLSGVTIRAAAVPALAIPHNSTLFAPLILVAAVACDSRYWAVAILLTCHWIGTLQLTNTMHNRIRSQLLAEDRMSRAAFTDALTGLANRAAFDGALAERVASGPATIAMIDLDCFKPVNDTHGHDAGDEVLKSVALRIVATLDNRHLVARLGGDEFAILFHPSFDSADATCAAEEVVRALEAPFEIANANVTIGASIGLAAAIDGDDPRAFKRRADGCLYNAKRGGRGRVWSDLPRPGSYGPPDKLGQAA